MGETGLELQHAVHFPIDGAKDMTNKDESANKAVDILMPLHIYFCSISTHSRHHTEIKRPTNQVLLRTLYNELKVMRAKVIEQCRRKATRHK